ncbi:MAG: hypothetical protein E7606_02100 [Ruminococcaceae bacterium]|nr:hypothetical protein [Oscillospiraceae bacterium]
MKRFLVLMLCVLLICALPVSVFADTQYLPSGSGSETTEKSESLMQAELVAEQIMTYIQRNPEEISVIITLILTVLYQIRKHRALNKSILTLNNNAVAVAETSSGTMSGVSSTVTKYTDKMENLLTEVRANEEEKLKLAAALEASNKYLMTAKAANMEFANEVAELLVLANIPNSKKEELYARHRAAVSSIAELEAPLEAKENGTSEE